MKRIFVFSIICLLMFTGSFAQEVANFASREPVISPEIKGKEITFRISAPYAATVKLSGSWMKDSAVDMSKNENGLWTATVETPSPELYTYSFIVDGLPVTDPNNVFMQRDGTRYLSVLLIPGELTSNYFEASQRGNLSQVWYDSPTIGTTRRMFVYTPSGYETGTEKYPVLYLLHGAGGDEDAWSTMGRTCQIMDNLIQKKLAKPMLVVMPNGNPGQQAARTLLIAEKRLTGMIQKMQTYMFTALLRILYLILKRITGLLPNRTSRAIAGLSMGAGHTIRCTNLYPGFFSYICPLSNGIRIQDEKVKADYDTQFKAIEKSGLQALFPCMW